MWFLVFLNSLEYQQQQPGNIKGDDEMGSKAPGEDTDRDGYLSIL